MQHHTPGGVRHRSPGRLTRLIVAMALAIGTAITLPTVARADEVPKILLMLDASGSMNGSDPSGSTKMEAAKKALGNAVGALPPEAQVGLRVYGATQPGGKPTPEACADTQLVHPIGPLDKAALTTAINGFTARGETPIAYSLEQAAGDLGADGQRHIILVSDGEESCVPDPCDAVRSVVAQGIGLRIDTVGFGVDDVARNQLRCIADAAGGTYYDAKDADELESSLRRLSTRAIRPFSVQGTPVTGTTQPEDAPVLAVGQYTDRVAGSTQGDVFRYYTVKRTIPGSTLRASIVGRLPYGSGLSGIARGGWDLEMLASEASRPCYRAWNTGDDTAGIGKFVALTTTAWPIDPRATKPGPDAVACAEATEFTLKLRLSSGKTAVDVPIELVVTEEPPVRNADALPSGVAEVPEGTENVTAPTPGTPQRIVAGTSFNDALALSPGTYEVEIVPGETVFVKTRIDWGQSATIALDGPDPATPALKQLTLFDHLGLAIDVYAPDRSQMDSQEFLRWANYVKDVELSGSPDINVVPEVRYRNRWDSPRMYFDTSRGFAMAGDYYFTIGANQSVKSLDGVPIPVRFAFTVDGTPHGAPEYADALSAGASGSPSATPTAPGSSEDPSTTDPADRGIVPVVGGVLLGAGVLGAAGYLVWRRRR